MSENLKVGLLLLWTGKELLFELAIDEDGGVTALRAKIMMSMTVFINYVDHYG